MAENRGPQLAAVLGLFLGFTWLFIILRIYVRLYISKNWGSDDYLLLAAQASFTTYCACSLSGVKYGTGQHTVDLEKGDPSNIPRALMFWWLCELLYTTTTVFLRCSVAVFLLRICENKIQKGIIYATMFLVTVYSLGYFLLAVFQCSPVVFFWTQYIPGNTGKCIDPRIFPDATYAHSAISAAADWVLGLLPIAVIYNLKMNIRTKISVGVVLSFGLIAGIAAIIRVPSVKVLSITDDFLFATVDVAILSTIEPGLGIIATAACVLRPLFKKFYHLSGYGTARSNAHSTHPSAWRNSRAPNARKRTSGMGDEDGLGPGAVEMGVGGSVVTSATAAAASAQALPYPSKSPASSTTRGSEESFSSTERMDKIHVQRTVDVQRHARDGSDGDGQLTPWPRGS